MDTHLRLGDLWVEVVRKDIKNIHLSVAPPTGRVRIAAPHRMDIATIRLFAIHKLDWIRRQQRQFQSQARETPRDYVERESHYLWGQRYLLHIEEVAARPRVEVRPRRLCLYVRPHTTPERRQEILAAWYREELRRATQALLMTWESTLGVTAHKVFIQRMRTQWGSCNPQARTIRLNTELAKKPPACLEYVILHEMAHFWDHTHGVRFQRLLEGYLPAWRQVQKWLNELPVGEGL